MAQGYYVYDDITGVIMLAGRDEITDAFKASCTKSGQTFVTLDADAARPDPRTQKVNLPDKSIVAITPAPAVLPPPPAPLDNPFLIMLAAAKAKDG